MPEEIIESTLQAIRENLDKVELYGGHTLRKHTDIQVQALKYRLTKEDIRYSTSFWDMEVAVAVAQGKKIDFELDEKSRLYIASCEGRAFGVAKRLISGKRSHLKRLGNSFSGVAVKVRPETRNMEVKVRQERRKKRLRYEG